MGRVSKTRSSDDIEVRLAWLSITIPKEKDVLKRLDFIQERINLREQQARERHP